MGHLSKVKGRVVLAGAPGGGSSAILAHDFIAQSLGRDWKMTFLQATNVQQVIDEFRAPDFRGGLVTMPWKTMIIPHLDYVDDMVVRLGACNHVSVMENGALAGTNTDWVGIRNSLLEAEAPALADGGRRGLVIGAGGASRAAVYALATLGCKHVYIVNRDVSEVDALIRNVQNYEPQDRPNVIHVRSVQKAQLLPSPAYIVGTVPDFEPEAASELEAREIYATLLKSRESLQSGIMLDMCYHPLETRNLRLAKQHGWRVVDGVQVVGHQFKAQWRPWTSPEIDDRLEAAAWDVLRKTALTDPTVIPPRPKLHMRVKNRTVAVQPRSTRDANLSREDHSFVLDREDPLSQVRSSLKTYSDQDTSCPLSELGHVNIQPSHQSSINACHIWGRRPNSGFLRASSCPINVHGDANRLTHCNSAGVFKIPFLEMSFENPTARSRDGNKGDFNNQVELEQLHRTTSMAGFRLLTTLQYIFLDCDNVPAGSNTRNRYELEDVVQQWREMSTELLKLHRRRLREAAAALGWTDVAAKLRPADRFVRNGERHTQGARSATSIPNLQSLIEEAARTKFSDLGTKDYLSDPGTPSVRTRILVSRSGEVTTEFGPLLNIPDSGLQELLTTHLACPFQHKISGRIPSQVTLAANPTTPSFFTRHKSTYRVEYNIARESAQPPLQSPDLPTAREVLLFNPNNQIMEASLSAVYFHRDGKWVTPSSECGGMQSVTKMYALEKGWCSEEVVARSSLCDGEFIWLSNAVRGFFLGRIVLNAA